MPLRLNVATETGSGQLADGITPRQSSYQRAQQYAEADHALDLICLQALYRKQQQHANRHGQVAKAPQPA